MQHSVKTIIHLGILLILAESFCTNMYSMLSVATQKENAAKTNQNKTPQTEYDEDEIEGADDICQWHQHENEDAKHFIFAATIFPAQCLVYHTQKTKIYVALFLKVQWQPPRG